MDHLQEAKDKLKIIDALDLVRNVPVDCEDVAVLSHALIAIAEQNNHSLLKTVGRLMSEDMHNSSMRPCATCRTISSIVGEPVGCYHYQKIRKEKGA